jgi:hypothetical protein
MSFLRTRVSSRPFITGMERSVHNQSRPETLRLLDGLATVFGFPTNFKFSLAREKLANSFANYQTVIDNQHRPYEHAHRPPTNVLARC